MRLTPVLTESDLDDIVSVSESRGWKSVRKYVEVQKRNLAEQSLMCEGDRALENLARIRGARAGIEQLFNYIDKDAEKELNKRRENGKKKEKEKRV